MEKEQKKPPFNKAKVISVWSKKGGVTKTTCTYNIAGVLSKKGYNVLCIDADEQGDLTRRLLGTIIEKNGGEWFDDKLCLSDIFMNPDNAKKAIFPAEFNTIRSTIPKRHGIDIIPTKLRTNPGSSPTLEKINQGIAMDIIPQNNMIKAMEKLQKITYKMHKYHFILIDYGPEENNITYEMLKASEYVIVPMDMSSFSAEGIASTIDTINEIKAVYNPDLEIMGFLPCRVGKGNFDTQMLQIIRGTTGDLCFNTVIREDKENIGFSLSDNIPLAWHRTSHRALDDYISLTNEILERI